MKHSFKNVHFYDWEVLPQTRTSSSHDIKNFFIVMVRNLSRTFTSMTGPCSPKHDTANHTMLNYLFVLMLSSLSRSLTFMTGPSSSKHGPAHLTLLNNLFVLMLNSLSRILTFMFEPCSSDLPKHDSAKFIASKIVSSCC